MGPSRAGGGMVHSSPSSGIFFQGNMQSQGVGNNAQLGSFGNMTNPVNVMNSVATSGPSIGASSMVTDANSGGGPHLQRSASINTDSYARLPASPLSFTSNNPSISGSTIIDGPSNQGPHTHQLQIQQPTTAQFPPPRLGQVGSRAPGSFGQDLDNITHLQKKPRLDIKPEDMMQQQVVQQILQRQDSMQLQSPNPNPQFQALIQQQRLRQQQQQQQQLLQSLPPVQRAHLLQQQQQQLQLRQQLQQQGLQPSSAAKRPHDGGVCSRRLMQYLYHQRQRPADNSIAYWRKFVAEYYSPRAKKRWCLSLYDNVGHHSLGVFPQAAVDAWQCDICGSKSGRGFEATFEVLPRLNEIKFSSGVIDEIMFLDLPRESRFPSGLMMLEYGKAVQESIYEQLRVVRQGQLKVIFTPDLKILTWEFCARRHEELLPRRLVAPQVNQLLQVAQKCQSTIAEGGSDGVSQQDLQTNSNMVVTSWRQLARSLELQSLNDLGFSKRYVRCLQISEVVSSMKNLMDFCQETKVGAIEGLKSYPRLSNTGKLQIHELEQTSTAAQNNSNNSKVGGLHAGPLNNNSQLQHSALTLTNYQNMLMRQKSMNSNSQQESPSMNQNGGSLQGWGLQNSNRVNGGFPSTHLLQHQQQQSPSQGGSSQQQHMIQQLLQGMNNNGSGGGGGGPKPSVSGQSGGSGSIGGRYMTPPPAATRASPQPHPNGPGGGSVGPSRSNSFKGPTQSDSSAGATGGGPKAAAAGLPHMSEDIGSDFATNAFFNNDDFDDTINIAAAYAWKD